MREVENFYQGYDQGWNWVTKTNTVEMSDECYDGLIRSAQEDYLDGYGFDWSDWDAIIVLSDEITAQIEWTHKTTGRKLALTRIFFDEASGAIHQAGTNYGDLTL